MKKSIITSILLLSIFTISFGQETKSVNQPMSRQDYLKKSKNQKTAAWILLGAGATSIALVSPGNSSLNTTGVVIVAGGAAIITSIPLFIAAGRNKRKAMSATTYLKLEKISDNKFGWSKTGSIPAVSFKISL